MTPLPVRLSGLAFAVLLAGLPPAHAEIRIGIAGPMTTGDAAFGAQMRAGVEQAIDDINAAGGLLGQTLTPAVGDDGADPKRGRVLASRFIGDGIRFVIGDFNSSVTLAASELYAGAGVLTITPGATNPRVTERGFETVFRICGRDDEQAAVASEYFAAQPGKRIAILHDQTSYGQSLADGLRAALARRGIQETFYDGVARGERNFAATLARIDAAGADFLYWSGGASDGGALVRQLHERGRTIVMVGADALAGEEFASLAGAGGEGTLMTFPRDPRTQPAAVDLVRRLTAKGISPDPTTLYAYASLQAIKKGVEAARSLDAKAAAAALHASPAFATVLGPIGFDGKGDLTRSEHIVYVWRKGPDGRLAFYPLGR